MSRRLAHLRSGGATPELIGEQAEETTEDDGIPRGGAVAGQDELEDRFELESVGSIYEPSDEEEGGDRHRRLDMTDSEPGSLLSEVEGKPSRKRPRSSTLDDRPLKRLKRPFNAEFLKLLNVDIEDAASNFVPHGGLDLGTSQLGMVMWQPDDKEMFFESLARVGRDNVKSIAERVETKSELEVRQYLMLLEDALVARRNHDELESMDAAEVPAAVEISQSCCNALEEAADAIFLRQDRYEEKAERRKWGDSWLITQGNWKSIASDSPEALRALAIFRIPTWLKLSEGIFMNSVSPENNWQHVADEPPSIRATALQDFHGLVLSITKRLVNASIYVAQSRIRSKKKLNSTTRNLVRMRDVEAAALSLGLPTSSADFWARCARRLELEVLDLPQGVERDEELKPMSYEVVEKALNAFRGSNTADAVTGDEDASFDNNAASRSGTPVSNDLEGRDSATGTDDNAEDEDEDSVEDEDVVQEANEILLHSAFEYPQTTRARQALNVRIKSEREQEDYADDVDRRISYLEEKRLWRMLGRSPAEPIVKVDRPGPPPPKFRPGNHTYDYFHPDSRDWRDKMSYASDWQTNSRAAEK